VSADRPLRVPDEESEARLVELRREAEQRGVVSGAGARPAGAPFPQATPESGYYGIPLLKEPQWKWEVPLYFFIGGAAGASAVLAATANWSGADKEMARDARWIAALGGPVSAALLTMDLGKPARFLNMMRVFKVQSPMSVGAWTLAAFSTASAASAFANAIDRKFDGLMPVRVLGNAAEALAAATGLVMTTYTGVLIGATAIPVWNENVRTLPVHFAASGLASAVSILELMGHESPALNALGGLAAVLESLEGMNIEMEMDRVNDPLKYGVSGAITRAGGALSGPIPLLLRIAAAATGSREIRRAAAWSSLAGALLTRFAWLRAGHASARDHRLPLELPDEQQRIPGPTSIENALDTGKYEDLKAVKR
jgi:formate-dependent nitrite reductase membrane component NrfD